MIKPYTKDFWFDNAKNCREFRLLYKQRSKNKAQIDSIIAHFENWAPIHQSEEFEDLLKAYKEEFSYEEILPFIHKLSKYLRNEGLKADDENKIIWKNELEYIKPIKECFDNELSFRILDERIKLYRNQTIFSDETEFLNFMLHVKEKDAMKELSDAFDRYYKSVLRGATVFAKRFPEFWKKEFEIYHEVWKGLVRINLRYDKLIENINLCHRESFYKDRKEFTELRMGILQYQTTKNANERCEYLEDKYHSLYNDISEEFKKTGIRLSSVFPSFYEASFDEEREVMKSFREGNQDHYGF